MEKRTMAEIRREKFNKQGKLARELADLALQEIDDALAEVLPFRRPGEIGSVAVRPMYSGDPLDQPIEPVTDWPEPPNDAA